MPRKLLLSWSSGKDSAWALHCLRRRGEYKVVGLLTTFNAANCSLASNEALDDLTQYQVTESLAKFNLVTCTDDYVAWSSDADQAQLGMLAVLKADGSAARASATVTLQHDLATLNADRATIAAILHPAEHTLADPAPLPALPS